MPVFCDSQSAIHLDTNLVYHIKTKHIDVNYHFVRQVIGEGGVDLKTVHSQENCADMFTKRILLEKLRWCVASLGLKKNVINSLEKSIRKFCFQGGVVNNHN